MRHTTQLYNTKKALLSIPVFTAEGGKKREEENVRRMNDFYRELKNAVTGYTQSRDFPDGGRYFLRTAVTESENDTLVSINMRLKKEGALLSQRTLCHTWRDGIITRYEK